MTCLSFYRRFYLGRPDQTDCHQLPVHYYHFQHVVCRPTQPSTADVLLVERSRQSTSLAVHCDNHTTTCPTWVHLDRFLTKTESVTSLPNTINTEYFSSGTITSHAEYDSHNLTTLKDNCNQQIS